MNLDIIKHFEMKLLWESRSFMVGNEIKEIYFQPDRLNPEEEFDPSVYTNHDDYYRFEKAFCEELLCDSQNTTNK